MNTPVYDEIISVTTLNEHHAPDGSEFFPLVVHRTPSGAVAVAHTPMEEDDVRCTICESGVKVWVNDR